jgi:hypothetical protein
VAHFDDKHPHDLEARMRRDDPRFAKALGSGRPCRPREYRHRGAWLVLAIALACLGAGIALGHGLLIASGLVVAGAAGHLFDPQRARSRGSDPPSTR